MRTAYPSPNQVARKELQEVIASTEALLKALGDGGGEAVEELRGRLTETIADVKKELGSSIFATARDTISRARDTATATDDFVRSRPWTAVAAGVGVGLVLGWIMSGE
jgi:ElaB/YqjD/DUF883 family membrane-anchored ribosome-binding protein